MKKLSDELPKRESSSSSNRAAVMLRAKVQQNPPRKIQNPLPTSLQQSSQ